MRSSKRAEPAETAYATPSTTSYRNRGCVVQETHHEAHEENLITETRRLGERLEFRRSGSCARMIESVERASMSLCLCGLFFRLADELVAEAVDGDDVLRHLGVGFDFLPEA